MESKLDLTIVIPAWKEGDAPREAMTTLLKVLEDMGRPYEVLLMDNSGEKNSQKLSVELNKLNLNFKSVVIPHPGISVVDKSNKYTIGNLMAKGKYIVYMDSEGQDRPEELPKFIKKLDEGFDLVVGWKQNRKDGFFYKLTSAMTNWLMRVLTGVKIHDMNNGFKAMRASVAKEINIRGGNFRFLPAIYTAKKFKITEVPVRHEERTKGGPGRFDFKSRLFGGMFDLPITILVSKMGDTPIYFWGLTAIFSFILAIISFIVFSLLYINGISTLSSLFMYLSLLLIPTFLVITVISLFFGISTEYNRANEKRKLEDFEIDKVID